MKSIIKSLIFSCVLLFCISNAYAQPQGYNHPELKWYTIETEHFQIHYHNGIEYTPAKVAKIAEQIYPVITSSYNFEPDGQIHIVLKDTDDYANGGAYFYDNKIEIWATPSDFVLRGTENWLRNVVSHEFVHMIQLQASRKAPRQFPAIYFQHINYEKEKRDDVLWGYPNQIISYPIAMTVVPAWFAEGCAQYNTFQLGNDYWDSHRDMILRMRAMSSSLYSLKEMGHFGKSSIGNESVYNQGFSLVKYIAEKYGDESLEKISRELGKAYSLGIEGGIKRGLGISGKKVYQDWKNYVESDYNARTKNIKDKKIAGEVIFEKGSANFHPIISPDGKYLAFLSNGPSDYISQKALYLLDLETKKEKLLKPGAASTLSFSPDGKKIYYSRREKTSTGAYLFDIFSYDLESNKEERLTKLQRANFCRLSPDGTKIVFSSGIDGTYNLFLLDLNSKDIKRLTGYVNGEEIFTPDWMPDNNRVVFALSKDLERNIVSLSLDDQKTDVLIEGRIDARDPFVSKNGNYLYYSSDETGIFNIYRYDFSTGDSERLTNVLGGAFTPSVTEQGELYFSVYTETGFKLAFLNNPQPVNAESAYKPSKDILIKDRPDLNSNFTLPETKEYKSKYSKTFILPRILMDYGYPKIGFYGYSNDRLDKYSMLAGFDVNRKKDIDAFALLDYRKFKPTLFLELYYISRHTKFSFPPNEEEDVKFSLFEADLGFSQKLSDELDLRTTLIYSRYTANITMTKPEKLRPFRYNYAIIRDLNVQLNYSRILPRKDMQINPSGGRKVSLKYDLQRNDFFEDFSYDEEAGSINEVYKTYFYNQFYLNWSEYLEIPVGVKRNALSLQGQFGYIDREVDDFFYFYAGGLPGLRGYSYYSVEGLKMAIFRATYRTPLIRNTGLKIGPWYFDKLYGSVTYEWGNAWSGGVDIDKFRKDVVLGLRCDMFSWYLYPTRVEFNAAYGLDKFQYKGGTIGNEWRYYIQVLFDYN